MAHAQRSAALADPAGKEPGDVPGRRRNLKRSALVVEEHEADSKVSWPLFLWDGDGILVHIIN